MKAISLKPAGTAINFRIGDYFRKKFGAKKSFPYFCSAKISMMVSPFRGASVIGSKFRAFFMPLHNQLRLSYPRNFLLFGGNRYGCFGERDMTAVSLSISQNIHNGMKANSLKPAGTAINFRILAPVAQFLNKYAMTVAAISAGVTLIASAFDAHWLSIPAAFIALGTIYYETEMNV